MAALVWVVFMFQVIAGRLFWYSLIWWFDMPMHFFGGVFLALLIVWIFLKIRPVLCIRPSPGTLLVLALSVLVVGVLWEVFELALNIYVTFDRINLYDSASDLFFDLAGGMIGIVYALRKAPRLVSDMENKNTGV